MGKTKSTKPEETEMRYKHKLDKKTYTPIAAIKGGVTFKVVETGEVKTLTNHQVARLLTPA